jgi:hypothetical protein
MPRWNVYGAVTGSKYLGQFEADTEEEAIAKAEDSDQTYVSLCHQCSDQCGDPEIGKITAERL